MVSKIVDALHDYTDGDNLNGESDWSVAVVSGNGRLQSDQHHQHMHYQVQDMSNIGQSYALHQTPLDSDDHTVEIRVFPDVSSTTRSQHSVLMRINSTTPSLSTQNGYEFQVEWRNGSATADIFRWDNNVRTSIANISEIFSTLSLPSATEVAGMVRLTGVISGSTIKGYFQGREILSATDTTHTVGKAVGFLQNRIVASGTSQPFVSQFTAWTGTETGLIWNDIIQATGRGTGYTFPWEDNLDCIFDTTPTAGNLLLAIFEWHDDEIDNGAQLSLTSFVDNANTSGWTQVIAEEDATSWYRGLYVYSKTSDGDEASVTATFSDPGSGTITLIELPSTYSIDTVASATHPADDPWSGALTTGTLSSDSKIGFGGGNFRLERDALDVAGWQPDAAAWPAAYGADSRWLFPRKAYYQQGVSTGTEQQGTFWLSAHELGTATTAWAIEAVASANYEIYTEAMSFAVVVKKSAAGNPSTVGAGSFALAASGTVVKAGDVAAAGGGARVTDTFTYGDGELAAVSSGAWVQETGTLEVDSGQVLVTVASTDSYYTSATACTTQTQDVSADITIQNTQRWGGVTLRGSTGALTCYWFRWRSGTYELAQMLNGAYTLLATTSAPDFPATRTLKLTAVDDGSGGVDLECFADDVSVLTHNDATPLTGDRIGLLAFQSSILSGPTLHDNFDGGDSAAATGMVLDSPADAVKAAAATGTASLAFAASGTVDVAEQPSTTGATSLTLAASAAVVKGGDSAAATGMVLDSPADAVKAGESTSSTSFALAASGIDVKSGAATGAATVALSAVAAPAGKTAAATGAASLAFAASGLAGATEQHSTTGATSLTLAASAAVVKAAAAAATATVALAASAAVVKSAGVSGATSLALSAAAAPAGKTSAATGAASLAFAASGTVGSFADKSATAATAVSLSASGAVVKASASTAATGFGLSASGTGVKAGAGSATSQLALVAASLAARAGSVSGSTSLSLAAAGLAGAFEGKSSVGSTSIVFNLAGAVVKAASPYGTAAIAFGTSGGTVKAGSVNGAGPLTITTVGTPFKVTGVAGVSSLALAASLAAAKVAATIASTDLTFVGVGSVNVGDGSYRPDPGRTLNVGDSQRVLRVQPRGRVVHVAPADRRFTWR